MKVTPKPRAHRNVVSLPKANARGTQHGSRSDSPARDEENTPQVFGSVFDALADTPQEAANMRARAQLARQITVAIRDKKWTQAVSAAHCGVTQPRINDLLNGRVSKFSLDALVNIASALGEVNVELREQAECA
jgi:predicted XRE-type DNA-binding protein